MLTDGSKCFASKLVPKFKGPFQIVEKRSPVVFVLKVCDSRRNNKVRVQDLKFLVLSRGK